MQTPEPQATYRGPKAPVTCLAVGGKENKTIFAGSWDKDIWSWDIESRQPGRKYSGHSDFVKAVLCTKLGEQDILVSGGADKKIIVWDIETGRRLHTIQDPTMTMLAVQHLALDPEYSGIERFVLYCASSDPHIRRWEITLDSCEPFTKSCHGAPPTENLTIEAHDTSVYRLVFDEYAEDLDLWTASADGTAKCLERRHGFAAADSLQHGDYVRAVQPTSNWVITAGRDEDVKVWDRASGKLYCSLEGHFEEITDLLLLRDALGYPQKVCSVSIDGTIRTWPLQKAELDAAVKKMEEAKKQSTQEKQTEEVESLLTAEEEAELAELMDD